MIEQASLRLSKVMTSFSSTLDALSRVASLRPADAQTTSLPAALMDAATETPMFPGWRTPMICCVISTPAFEWSEEDLTPSVEESGTEHFDRVPIL